MFGFPRYRRRWFEKSPGEPGPRYYRNFSLVEGEYYWAVAHGRFRLAHKLALEVPAASDVIFADSIPKRDRVVGKKRS